MEASRSSARSRWGPRHRACRAPPAQATPPAKPTLKTWGASSAVKSQVIVGTTLYFGGDFTSVTSSDGTTSVARRHLAAID